VPAGGGAKCPAGDPAEVLMAVQAAQQMVTCSRRPMGSHGVPILASKITKPNVPGWILQRPRVTTLIAQGTRWCPLTIVTGLPGTGKTMALALWAAAGPGPVAWVTPDKYDNRPRVFWSYVVAALRRSGVAVPKALSATTRGRTAEHPFLLRLASVLAAQDPPVTLVVDDFHLLTEPRVLDGLDFLLRNGGAGLRVAIASRSVPPLPLHRYRLAGELTEIRADDLAFTVAEAGQMLARHGCPLSDGSLDCLMRHTEGWAAGLRLAAISLAARRDPDQFVGQLVTEDSALTDYLVQEVLDTQPREAREVLLKASILEHVNAEIATELTDNEEAGRILTALADASAFVQPIGGGWYRFHTLFAEMLRRRLRLEYPGQAPALHRRAARWYERANRLTEAVRHAAQASAWPLAARMVIDGLAIGEIIEPRGGRSLADELAAMPHGEVWTEPQPYLVSAAIALSAGQPESAAATLDAVEKTFKRLPAGAEDAVRLAAAMIRLAAARRTGDHGFRMTGSPSSKGSARACWPPAELPSYGRAGSMRRPGPSMRGWPPPPRQNKTANASTASAISRSRKRCAAGSAAPPNWPARRQRSLLATGHEGRASMRPPWPPWPGCTSSAMSCARSAASSSRWTQPLGGALTS